MTPRAADADTGGKSWSDAAIQLDPLGFIAFHRAEMKSLGDLLERIADQLPHAAGGAAPMLAAARLRRCAAGPTVCERALFALIERRSVDGDTALAVVDIARREATGGCGGAIELADALESLACDGGCAAPNALGFMLRACFDSLRRRSEWMGAVLLPQARAVLGDDDIAALGRHLAQAAAPAPRFAVVQGGRR